MTNCLLKVTLKATYTLDLPNVGYTLFKFSQLNGIIATKRKPKYNYKDMGFIVLSFWAGT